MLTKLLPYAKAAGLALLAAVGVGYATYTTNHDLAAALVAGFGALVAKLLPSHLPPS
jgi:hypothetical protein